VGIISENRKHKKKKTPTQHLSSSTLLLFFLLSFYVRSCSLCWLDTLFLLPPFCQFNFCSLFAFRVCFSYCIYFASISLFAQLLSLLFYLVNILQQDTNSVIYNFIRFYSIQLTTCILNSETDIMHMQYKL
jgi:hypothetical protein